jgi:hypothetical protein
MPHLMRHPACLREVPLLRDEGRSLFFWIPAGVYPDENRGRNDNYSKGIYDAVHWRVSKRLNRFFSMDPYYLPDWFSYLYFPDRYQ